MVEYGWMMQNTAHHDRHQLLRRSFPETRTPRQWALWPFSLPVPLKFEATCPRIKCSIISIAYLNYLYYLSPTYHIMIHNDHHKYLDVSRILETLWAPEVTHRKIVSASRIQPRSIRTTEDSTWANLRPWRYHDIMEIVKISKEKLEKIAIIYTHIYIYI